MATIQIDRDALIEALRELEVIVPSIARIGSMSAHLSSAESNALLSALFDDWRVGPRLARVRRLLSDFLPYDEHETLFEGIERWTAARRKPSAESIAMFDLTDETVNEIVDPSAFLRKGVRQTSFSTRR